MTESMHHTARDFVVFEGYDGSGKSSLIDALRSTSRRSVRVIGRKKEPELVDIARILEREDERPNPSVEMLLRIAVEAEREQIISRSLISDDLVVCDRGFASLTSWFDYLDVDREPFNRILDSLLVCHERAVTIVCTADFDTCWERSSKRPETEKSRKDRLGKDVNRRYFDQYEANVRKYADAGFTVVFVDTMRLDISQSTALIVQALETHGLLEPQVNVGRLE